MINIFMWQIKKVDLVAHCLHTVLMPAFSLEEELLAHLIEEQVFQALSNVDGSSRSHTSSTKLRLVIVRQSLTADSSTLTLPSLPFLAQGKNSIFLGSSAFWDRSTLMVLMQSRDEIWLPLIALKTLESSNWQHGKRMAYIQWLDTCGFTEPRSLQSKLTRSMLFGYLDFLKKFKSTMLAMFATSHSEMHSSTAAVQSFFFKNSEKNGLKKLLRGKDVSEWWLRTLGLYMQRQPQEQPKLFQLEPRSFEAKKASFVFNLHVNKQASLKKGQHEINVHCGLPFQIAQVRDVPLFPDDPLSSHLALYCDLPENQKKRRKVESLSSRSLNEREFLCSMFCKSEYTREVGASHVFLMNDFGAFDTPGPPFQGLRCVGQALETLLSTLLHTASFNTLKDALDSANSWNALLKECFSSDFSISYDVSALTEHKILEEPTSPLTPVTNLQSFIKRKRTS